MNLPFSAWLAPLAAWPVPALWVLKGSVLLVLGALAALGLHARRAAAEDRHRAWAWTLGGALLLPFLAGVLPEWSAPLARPAAAARTEPARTIAAQPPTKAAPTAAVATTVAPPPEVEARQLVPRRPAVAPPAPLARQTSVWQLLAGVWALGALAAIVPLIVGVASVVRLARAARSVDDARLAGALSAACAALGVVRPVRLLVSAERAMPMTWGWRRPVVLLPAEALQWSERRLRAILCHELAHVARGDSLARVMAQVSRAVYWFHPLSHVAVQQLEREQELACDDRALRAGLSPQEYARHLLAVAALRPRRLAGPAALAMARPGRLERRLRAILDERRPRGPQSARLRRIGALAALVAAAALATLAPPATAGQDRPAQADETAAEGQSFEQLRTRILERYISRPDERKLLSGALEGMLQALDDPYTAYVPPDHWTELLAQVEGRLSGIGAELKADGDRVVVSRALPGSAAEQAGLLPEDRIVSIDGQPADGTDLSAVVKRIRGPVGSQVTLRIVREGEPEKELRITRAPISLSQDSVRGFALEAPANRRQYWLDPEQKIAYVGLHELGPKTAEELRKTLEPLSQAGLRGLVLDLRSSPGGLAEQALAVAKLFSKQGALLTAFHGRGDKVTKRTAEQDGPWSTLPLVVLVNQRTASAAELLAGALAARPDTALVGTRTFGKGSVQELVPLGDGLGGVRLTTGFYRLPSGRDVQRQPGKTEWGVDPTEGDYVPVPEDKQAALEERLFAEPKPDYGNPPTRERIEQDESDPQLAAAMRALSGRLAEGRFSSVGQPLPGAESFAERQQQVEQRRKELLRQLKRLNEELGRLEAH